MIEIEHLELVGSTQDVMKERLSSLDPGKITAITAKEQTAGRGREGRAFRSPPGGLYMTAALHIEGPLQKHIALSLLVGLAISRLIPKIRLKWPNDLLIDHKKVGGILIETRAPWWLVGIGINQTTPLQHLEGLDRPVTTLVQEKADLLSLDRKILESLQAMLPQFLSEGFAPFQKEYLEKSAYALGSEIIVRGHGVCIFEGITSEGELSVRVGEKREDLNFGEICF